MSTEREPLGTTYITTIIVSNVIYSVRNGFNTVYSMRDGFNMVYSMREGFNVWGSTSIVCSKWKSIYSE